MTASLLLLCVFAQEPLETWSDVGYRTLWGQNGSLNTYRSVVNLGEGPRLLQFQSRFQRANETYRIHGANWGDPLNTFQLNAEKTALYRLNFQYRNLAYFNALPSFASPQLNRLGSDALTTNQNSLDTRQRFWNLDLDLLPTRRWQPFFGIARNSGLGFGVSPLVLDENSYAAASRIDNAYTVYRGGLRYERDSLHLTLEQGGAVFSDSSSLANDLTNRGNREAPYFGSLLTLNRANRLYDLTGQQIYTSANLTVSPLSWLDFTGEFYFSQPKTNVRFNESAAGTILWLDTLRFVNGQQSLATGFASQPRTAGGFTLEVRPFSRLRIVETWQTERTHNAGSLALVTTLDSRALAPLQFNDRLVWNQHEHRVQAFVEVHPWLTLYGGHAYLTGDAQVRRAELSSGPPLDSGALRRHSALAGLAFTPHSRLSLHADSEVGRGDRTWFRTSLQNYEQLRLRGRYQLRDRWFLQSRFQRLANANAGLAFRNQQAGLGLQYIAPKLSVMADYTRSTIFSDIDYLDPVLYRPQRSLYRDNAHSGTLTVDLQLPRQATLTAGGSLFRSAGSRPSRFYQPLVRLRIPMARNASFLAEWRHYSMGQPLYTYESFRIQQLTLGLRLGSSPAPTR